MSFFKAGMVTVLVVCTCGCKKETPERAFQAMKEAACAGDGDAFFKHVDIARLKEADSPVEKARSEPQSGVPAQAPPPSRTEGLVREVNRGSAGELCKMIFVSAKLDGDDKAQVSVLTSRGSEGTLHFERLGDTWKVVDIGRPAINKAP